MYCVYMCDYMHLQCVYNVCMYMRCGFQAEASLSSYIGTVNYSGTFAMQSAHFNKQDNTISTSLGNVSIEEKEMNDDNRNTLPIAENIGLFDPEKLSNAIDHANQITLSYGVTVMSINIISAVPKDMDLMRSLAKGAVAAAEAQQMVATCICHAMPCSFTLSTLLQCCCTAVDVANSTFDCDVCWCWLR